MPLWRLWASLLCPRPPFCSFDDDDVYEFLGAQLESVFAMLYRQERVSHLGRGWPKNADFDAETGYVERDQAANSNENARRDPERYQLQRGEMDFDDAVDELLARAFPDGIPTGHTVWFHVAPWEFACAVAYSPDNVLDIPYKQTNDFSSTRAVYFWPGCSRYQASRHDEFAASRNANQVCGASIDLYLHSESCYHQEVVQFKTTTLRFA